ncbi:protein kinase domain-containing protein [Polyangium mundeleinium]|uniref:Protein kinase n=1 Tax=Polyangium mundeleinium TaxID=2995306 RepID=A0ABT5EKZ3_9BACT|nr:serine/threonine-protein kinase [Polyangium mundeleinium]MDC0742471.1 protein kinase [Polyangium mundeleinium]
MALEPQTATGSASKLGKYELTREMSGSGVASTWLAQTEGSTKSYIVLRLHKHVTKKPEVAEAFLRDAKNGKLLTHANVVPTVETGVGDGEIFVVAEHFEGETLSSLVTNAKTAGIPLPIALRIGLEMLEGLAAAHAQSEPIAHGELSPFHVQVGKDGVTRVGGFGWARALAKLGPHGIMKQDRLAYAPPERVKAMSAATPGGPTGTIDPKGDVFAAAVILWELIAKQRLFASKMEAAVVQKVLSGPIQELSSVMIEGLPTALEEALPKAMERDPAKRASLDSLLQALRSVSADKLAKPEEVGAFVEKFASKPAAAPAVAPAASPAVAPAAAAGPKPAPAAAARPPQPTVVGVAAPGTNGKAPLGVKAPTVTAPVATPAAEKKDAAEDKAAGPTVPKLGAPKPMARQRTLVGGVEPPKPAAAVVPKPVTKAEPAAEAKEPAEAKAAAKPADKPADKPEVAPAAEAKKPVVPPPAKAAPPPPKPGVGMPKPPTPPVVGAKPEVPKPPPPVRPVAESLPGEDIEIDDDADAFKVEVKDAPKAEEPKAEAKKPEEPKAEEPKAEAKKPEESKAEEPKAEDKPEHVVVTKSEMPTVVTKTPTTGPSPADSDGSEAPVSRTKATALDRLKPGSTLGRYEILLRVAKGGMASVWAARLQGSRGFQKTVAIKTMLPDVSDDPDFETMFLDEARVAARIRHPNVVEIFDLGEQDDILYIVMEWVEGDTLSTVQKAAKTLGGIPQNIILRLASQICAGLHAAHELRDDNGALVDLVHRDISPGNILISTSGFAKIADFGVAKSRGRLYVTRAEGVVKGKTPYLSPEQLGGLPLDRRSDLFSLGVLLYVMVTGLHPFRGETEFKTVENIALKDPIPPRELVPSIHADFEKVILKALEKDRTKRYSTAGEMQRAIDQVSTQVGTPITDEDVADFVRKVIGEANAKRAAELRAAIATADANLAADRASIPPPMTSEPKVDSKPEAAAKAGNEAVDVPVFADAGATSPAVPAAPPVPRLETLQSAPIPSPTTAQPAAKDDDDLLLAAQASQKKKRIVIGIGAFAAVAIGAVVALSGGDKSEKPTPTTTEQAPTTQATPPPQPTEAKQPEPTPTPTAEPPKPEEPKPEEPKAEEPAVAAPEATQAAAGENKAPTTWKAPAVNTTKTVRPPSTGTSKTTKTTKKTTKFDPTGI